MKKIYLSGKITGIEQEAPNLFESAEHEVIEKGFYAVNPMKIEHKHDKSWSSYMKHDIKALMDCDAIYMLSNWTDSKGANIEFNLAVDLGFDVLFQSSGASAKNRLDALDKCTEKYPEIRTTPLQKGS